MAVAGLSARPYIDHSVNLRLANDLRGHGFDAVAALEIGMEKATDEVHLRHAAAEGRVLITHDFHDFPPLAELWQERGEHHAGILLSLQPPWVPYGELLRRVLRVLDTYTADELTDVVLWLDEAW